MARRLLLDGPKAVIAVAPASEGDSASDGAARLAAESFADWLTEELGGADRWGDDEKIYREVVEMPFVCCKRHYHIV